MGVKIIFTGAVSSNLQYNSKYFLLSWLLKKIHLLQYNSNCPRS